MIDVADPGEIAARVRPLLQEAHSASHVVFLGSAPKTVGN
jgi:hypothetical protein